MKTKFFLFKIILFIISLLISLFFLSNISIKTIYYYPALVFVAIIIYFIMDKLTANYQSEIVIENFDFIAGLRNLGSSAASTVCSGYIRERDACNSEKAQLYNIKAQLENQINQYKEVVQQLYQKQLQLINSSSNNINTQLADKNRLLASVNTNIQTSYSKLSEINDRINTITQDIHSNNADLELKEKIEITIRAIIGVLVLLLIIMICYYGSDIAQERFPNIYNSLKTSLSPTGFTFT